MALKVKMENLIENVESDINRDAGEVKEQKTDTSPKMMTDMDEITDLFGEKKKAEADFEAELKKRNVSVIRDIDIDKLKENPDNHFSKIEGEKWDEFLASVREYGVIVPLIVRPLDFGKYEIIAGHNRLRAAREVGLKAVPARIVEVDDVEASVLMGISNAQRENTTDLEWGWAYRNTYEALKRPTGRKKENGTQSGNHSEEENGTQNGNHLKGVKTLEIVAGKYGVGKNTVQRKMRLTYLMAPLYENYLKKAFTQDTMVTLSYLNSREQATLAGMLSFDGGTVTSDMAKELKELSDKDQLDAGAIEEIWKKYNDGKVKEKVKRPVKYSVADDCFPEGLKKGDRAGYIEKALRYIMLNHIDLDEKQ